MAKKDFDYEGLDIFAFFGGEAAMPEEITVGSNTSDSVELGNLDEDEDESSDLSVEDSNDCDTERTSTAANKSTKKASKKNTLTGTSSFDLPVICRGRNWELEITGLGTCTYNEIVKQLYDRGIKEVALENVTPLPIDKGIIYFTSPTKETADSTLVSFVGGELLICDGLEQMDISISSFPGMLQEEISLLHAQEAWEKNFPHYENQSLYYDGKVQIAIPVLNTVVKDEDIVSLPCNVSKCGKQIRLTNDDFIPHETVRGGDILHYLFEDSLPATAVLKKNSQNMYFVEFSSTKSKTAVSKIERNIFVVNKDSKTEVAKELYQLPANIYFVTLNATIPVTADMFGGKEKVCEQDIVDLLKRSYSLLRNKDRKVEVVYAKEENLISVALTSGRKGSNSYAFPESSHVGIFKLLRTKQELDEAMGHDNFFGTYVPDGTAAQRIEVTPVGTFIGTCGTGRECCVIKEVAFKSKLPKISYNIYHAICADFKAHLDVERIVRIYWNTNTHAYQLVAPDAANTTASKCLIDYQFPIVPDYMKLVMTIHSHNTMPSVFSKTDDIDEAITGVYGVIGNLHHTPTASFRVGMEGCFSYLDFNSLFTKEAIV